MADINNVLFVSPMDPEIREGDNPADSDITQVKSTSLGVTPPITEILAKGTALAPMTRFWYLLPHARTLIRLHGPYTTHENTTVFCRAYKIRSIHESKPPSIQLFATSLAAAEDAYGSAQPDGPAKSDLELFTVLWQTSVQVVELILEGGISDGEAFGWGVYGLTSGYLPSFPSTPPLPLSAGDYGHFDDDFFPESKQRPLGVPPATLRKPQSAFDILRRRLHTALLSLPGVKNVERERDQKHRMPSVSPAERVGRLINTRNEVHLCGTLLVQIFREAEWRSVRWGHLILIVERWLGNLELTR